ncbi:hypothetical protein BAX94_16545 [Elizabethkingia meningoseptica]|uniref:Uncharacterized protein n=2 Tax=Elizabethkingia meningoseptica TaxID=238 RepID=A0A1V3U0I6_ELIME|nr:MULTISPECIES: hypothetical protein [Elizabethkingia]AQX11720.1 hypothetical protein BBD35_04700 [Elizabethkingia meningoseptica]MBG0513159.1 hypothetical protein [Elizabethkingia meningoseptica]MDE5436081.1 hypothetical protein [Elizabethkingia meningoseptica]MDE5447736.1 hypothetical protein [Elizabethkingia meningoseptica]MDE5473115.1 hypothetical protein [Elizabethkingia meningoseptica]
MDSQLKEFYDNLYDNRFFDNKIYFSSLEMLSDNDIKKHFLEPINRNKFIYLYNVHNDNDIILGTKYNVVFDRNYPKNYQTIDCEIDFVALKKNDNIGIIPRGYGGIIRLKFKDKVSEITKVLMQDDKDKYDKTKHSFLYFTTQEVMGEILKELEKTENP